MVRTPTRAPSWRLQVTLAAIITVGYFLIAAPLGSRGEGIGEGDFAPRALTAIRDAQFESNVLTQAARDEAAAAVETAYFPADPAITVQQQEKLRAFFDAYRVLRQRSDLSRPRQVEDAERIPSALPIQPATRVTLLDASAADFETLRAAAIDGITEVLRAGVAAGEGATRAGEHIDRLAAAPIERRLDSDSLSALRNVLGAFVAENRSVDTEETRRRQDEERRAQPPVIVTYVKGQVIAPASKSLDAADIEALRATGAISSGLGYSRMGGVALIALALGLFGAPMVARGVDRRTGSAPVAVAAASVLAAFLCARAAYGPLLPDTGEEYIALALPIPAAALVVALFAGALPGAATAVLLGLASAFIATVEPDLAGAGFIGSLESLRMGVTIAAAGAAGAAVIGLRRGIPGFVASGVVSAAAGAGVLLAFWLVDEPHRASSLASLGIAGAASGLGSAAVAGAVALGTARWTGFLDRSRLARLAHSRHPLLRRLQAEAPGTFHHASMVATLAEHAAERIGADALLARAGALYHDVGKLARPTFYIENMADGALSPHEGLDPAESASIIREHVTRGISLAKDSGLPPAVVDFIPEHHGTRLVTYFYRLAAAQNQPTDPAPFRYAGPRPRSRETAIVMLADSSEAAVRAEPERGRARIDAIVDSILAERLGEGQLDECDLTLRELRVIAEVFKEQLRAAYHPRIAYPEPVPEELVRIAGTELR